MFLSLTVFALVPMSVCSAAVISKPVSSPTMNYSNSSRRGIPNHVDRHNLFPILSRAPNYPNRNSSHQSPSPVRRERDNRPTPTPTGAPSLDKTVHILSETDFSLLLPRYPGELVSEAEVDGVRFCSPESAAAGASECANVFQDGFIRAAAFVYSPDNSHVQVTGCLDISKSTLSPNDHGGQFDVRYPNGAFCTFGGYGASFIQLVEPFAGRFCMRCCAQANDQANCNSHQDRLGCMQAIPGTYQFSGGIDCTN